MKETSMGIIGAFDVEISHLFPLMTIENTIEIANKQFYQGYLEGQRVVMTLSGVGLINAAHTTQILIDHFAPQGIIFTGIAGTLTQEINIYDTVISSETVQFETDFSPLFPIGTIPFMQTSHFPADIKLIKLAQEAAFSLAEGKTFTGKIVSADKLRMPEDKQAFFKGLAMDAEGAAIGQVCFLNKIPYVCIRTISDTQDDLDKILIRAERAAKRSQQIVLGMLRLIFRN